MKKFSLLAVMILVLLVGCGGEVKQLSMRDASQKTSEPTQVVKTVEIPKGTWTGAASTEQVQTLAQLFVQSHNMALNELAKLREGNEALKGGQEAIKAGQEEIKGSVKRVEETQQKILESAQRHQETAKKTLEKIEELARKQGTGEITLFFPTGQAAWSEKSLEYERLVRFVDFLARESKGRKVVFVSIGSASAFGKPKVNLKLAEKRAQFPQGVIDKYLVNTPHDYYKVYGTGDLYSPKKVSRKEHERYQHVRILALFENDPIPPLPEGAGKK